MFTYILLAVAILNYRNVVAQMGMGMGPLNINLVDSTPCEGHKGDLDIRVISLGGDKKGFDMDINLTEPLDDTVSYEIRLDKVQNGQIQKGVFRHGGKNACIELNKFLGDFWKNLVKASGAPDECPTPPGKYNVEKYPFDEKEMEVKTFLYGRFLLNLEMFRNGEKHVCQVIEFTNSRPGESV